ncbi:hypothetical protein T4E_2584 [Trichinella pseudospiralis]|uniref:G-protein coupled receptors family 1 profile domain-containing protein n=1 Tax=Trichinella pseudospiralis TaxID=6337 RepID=A0A0V0Y3D6_TRIPS|nr:hypothetical protein T4E_2584 [Trichinella pseudospiralis]
MANVSLFCDANVKRTILSSENIWTVQHITGSLLVAIGILCLLTSSVTFTILLTTMKLRSSLSILIWNSVFNDFISGCCIIAFGIWQVKVALVGQCLKIGLCCKYVAVMIFVINNALYNIFLLTVENALHTCFPMNFLPFSRWKISLCFIVLQYMAALTQAFDITFKNNDKSVASSSSSSYVFCDNAVCVHTGLFGCVHCYMNFFLCISVIFINLFIVLFMRRKVIRYRRKGLLNLFLLKHTAEMQRLKMLMLITTLVIISQLLSRVCLFTASIMKNSDLVVIIKIIYRTMVSLLVAGNIIVYTLLSEEFRTTVRKLLFRHDVVSPFLTNTAVINRDSHT